MKKKSADDTKSMGNYPECKEQFLYFCLCLHIGRSDSDNLADDYKDNVVPDVFDKISEEIRDASFNENMQCEFLFIAFYSFR